MFNSENICPPYTRCGDCDHDKCSKKIKINNKYENIIEEKHVDIKEENNGYIGEFKGIPVQCVRWIPVSEGLPQYTDDYLVTVRVGNIFGSFDKVRTLRYEIFNGENSYKKWIIPFTTDESIEVLAWMPLPERYEEV